MRQKSNSSNNQSVMLTEIVQEPLRLALRWFSRTDSPPSPPAPQLASPSRSPGCVSRRGFVFQQL